jgi:uncharacterized delta-60 repeat protein
MLKHPRMRSTAAIRCLALALVLVPALWADAAVAKPRPGSFDRSFGSDGRVVLNLPGEGMYAAAFAIQPDGKIVVAGGISGGSALIARYLPDGRLDPGFGTGGIVRQGFALPVSVGGVAIQPDGKILLAGQASHGGAGGLSAAVMRFLPDGSVDHGFGSEGMALVDPNDSRRSVTVAWFSHLAVQPDGRIVAAGGMPARDVHDHADVVVARLLPGGEPDPSFDGDGSWEYLGDEVADILSHPDGHMTVVGWTEHYFEGSNLFAVRISTGPTSLPGLSQPGLEIGEYEFDQMAEARAVGLQADGSLVIAGDIPGDPYSPGTLAWVRVSPDLRMLDRRVVKGRGATVAAFDSRGALLTIGPPSLALARYRTPTLRRDYSFGLPIGTRLPLITNPSVLIGAAIRADKLLTAGYTWDPREEDHPLTLMRLHAGQDIGGPITSVHGLPRRRCVQGVVRPLVRVRDESEVRVEVRIDRRAVRRSRHKHIRLRLRTGRLSPGPHKLVITARDAAGNLGRSGSTFTVCPHG